MTFSIDYSYEDSNRTLERIATILAIDELSCRVFHYAVFIQQWCQVHHWCIATVCEMDWHCLSDVFTIIPLPSAAKTIDIVVYTKCSGCSLEHNYNKWPYHNKWTNTCLPTDYYCTWCFFSSSPFVKALFETKLFIKHIWKQSATVLIFIFSHHARLVMVLSAIFSVLWCLICPCPSACPSACPCPNSSAEVSIILAFNMAWGRSARSWCKSSSWDSDVYVLGCKMYHWLYLMWCDSVGLPNSKWKLNKKHYQIITGLVDHLFWCQMPAHMKM